MTSTKLFFLALAICTLFLLSGCQAGKENTQENKTDESTIQTSDSILPVEETTQSSITETITSTSEAETKEENTEPIKLLEKFGSAYANYSSIQDRNKKLMPLMTEKAQQENGIFVDDKNSGNKLSSQGKVETIYKPIDGKDNHYAVVLKVKQNGAESRVLLLVQVNAGKIESMTYNTIKQEY